MERVKEEKRKKGEREKMKDGMGKESGAGGR